MLQRDKEGGSERAGAARPSAHRPRSDVQMFHQPGQGCKSNEPLAADPASYLARCPVLLVLPRSGGFWAGQLLAY